jgi:flagellar hook-associated protein 2
MSSSSSGSLISIATFSGSSTYSSSFQQVLTRAVQIASLPGLQLEATIGTLTTQESALTGLESAYSTLETDIENVNTAAQGSLSASVSDSSILTASASSSASAGTYTVEVDDIGSAATALSNAGSTTVTDPSSGSISDSATYTLNVNGAITTITPSGTSLDDLASAINSANAGVQATVVNVGGSSGNDYRLALTSTTLGEQSIELDDSDGNALTTPQAAGSPVQYTVNGSTDDISSDSRTITLAPGLTVNMLSADSSTPVTITVGQNTSGLSKALSTLAADYNSAVTALTNQTGSADGALEGDSIIYSLRSMLSSLLDYTNASGSVANLNSLGLEVNSTGSMTFDSTAFDSLSSSDIAAFLGSTSSSGFLETAYNDLDSYTNSDSGVIYSALSTVEASITSDNGKLSDDETQVSTLQSNLMSQLSSADAAIATLESQKTYYQELFQAEFSSSSSS